MSKFSNLLKLTEMLKEEKLKSKDIALKLGVSERMVRKYIDDLKEADVNVISIPGPSGGYYIPKVGAEHGEAYANEIRFTYVCAKEKEIFIENLKKLYDIISISRTYINHRSEVEGERRIYIKIVNKTS